MKQFLPVLLLSFCLNKNAAAQQQYDPPVKTDTFEENGVKYTYKPMIGEFNGGDSAWQKYLEQNLVYPKRAKRKKIEGIVTVQFILSKDGFPAEVEALSGPEELRQSAIDVVKKSPKWWPAIQGGRQVKAFKKRDIVFKLEKE